MAMNLPMAPKSSSGNVSRRRQLSGSQPVFAGRGVVAFFFLSVFFLVEVSNH